MSLFDFEKPYGVYQQKLVYAENEEICRLTNELRGEIEKLKIRVGKLEVSTHGE